MSAFDDRFVNHAVFQTLANLRAQLDAAEEHLATTDLQEAHARLVEVADYIDRVLNAAEPSLSSKASLDALNSALQSTGNEVQQFVNTKQAARLIGNANTQADAAIQQARVMYVPLVPEEVEGLKDGLASFRRSAGQHLRSLEQEAATAKTSLEQQVDQARQSVAQTTQQIQTKLQEVEQAKQGLDNAVRQHESQFSTAQEERRKQFSESVEKRSEEFRSIVEGARTQLKEKLDMLVATGTGYIETLESLKAQVEEIVGAVGATALSGGFNETADTERRSANVWRWIGVGVTAVALLVAYYAVEPLHSTTQWTRLGAKAILVLPLLGLATYALKESAKHRRVQWRNRRVALELASIEPYLMLYPDEERNQIKKDLVERWFAQPEPVGDKDDDVSPSTLLRLLEQAINLLGKR